MQWYDMASVGIFGTLISRTSLSFIRFDLFSTNKLLWY